MGFQPSTVGMGNAALGGHWPVRKCHENVGPVPIGQLNHGGMVLIITLWAATGALFVGKPQGDFGEIMPRGKNGGFRGVKFLLRFVGTAAGKMLL